MRNFLEKYGLWLLCTVILVPVALLGFLLTQPSGAEAEAETPAVRFTLDSGAEAVTLSVYEAEDGSDYVFLPSYGEMAALKAVTAPGVRVTLDGAPLTDGMDCGGFRTETEYTLSVNEKTAPLTFLRSANVATLYLNTVSGNMDYIHKDRAYQETTSASLYTADGELVFSDSRCTLNSRGNTTWAYDKKPYALTLSAAADLLGMGEGVKWVLLANATDESNLHNKVIYDFAQQLDPQLAPDCDYVELYLNGSYSGLYLLTEAVEVGTSRLDIDTEAGDFLCSIDFQSRWDTLRSPFLTPAGRTVEISAPEYATVGQLNRIRELVEQMEQEILSGTLHAVDLDSWVRKYLIDEIFGNIDADLTSNNFYYKQGIFYAGPIWDYDMTFGTSYRNDNPETFIAKNAYKSASYVSPYYGALYETGAFYNRMTQIYQEEYLPALHSLLETELSQRADAIAAATQRNSLRWAEMFREQYLWSGLTPSTVTTITDYLEERIAFLNSVWLDGEVYHTVQLEVTEGSAYTNVSVPHGAPLDTVYGNDDGTVWYRPETGDAYDFRQPVMEDLILTKYPGGGDTENAMTTRELLTLLSVGVIAGLFLTLTVTDLHRRHQERRNANARRTVSP